MIKSEILKEAKTAGEILRITRMPHGFTKDLWVPLEVAEADKKAFEHEFEEKIERLEEELATWKKRVDDAEVYWLRKSKQLEKRISEAQQALFEFRENDLKVLLDEIERGCYKSQKDVLFEVIRIFDEKKLRAILAQFEEGGKSK